jgi:putative PIN family toxin of toxin-antitoxin system
MIAILDTNILISALFDPNSVSASLLHAWESGQFELLTCEQQFDEFRRVSRYPKIAARLSAPQAGKLILRMRKLAIQIERLPSVDRSKDPADNYLLALAQAGSADFLVTGDKADLLALGRHGSTQIVPLRVFVLLLDR